MKILNEKNKNKYAEAMKELEAVLNKHDIILEALCDGILVTIDDKEFRLYDKENAHYVGVLPRTLEEEVLITD